LIGLTLADPAFDSLPLTPTPPRRWRYARYAMAVVVPVGVLFAAHRITEPEGLDAAEQPASALAYVTATDSNGPQRAAVVRPPARSFDTDAFGHSNAVRVRVALPNDQLHLPIDFAGVTDGMQAQWISFDGRSNEAPGLWPTNGALRAPSRPGAYWLVLSRGGVTDTVADLALFVEHPMPNTMATGINGYHLGRWPKAADGIVPRGFIEVTDRLSDFPLSPHLRLSDFVVHDNQDGFPKYLHVRESLLDKVELVVNEIAQMRGRAPSMVKLNVASGFRSPAHNDALSGTAQDSRHMYGDAADIAIDANNDGKLTEIDARLVAAAAEIVERRYPDLVGGVGLYITPDGAGWPYVHIDTRGHRARWRGGVKRGGAVDTLPDGASFDTTALAVAKPKVVPTTVPAAAVATPAVSAAQTPAPVTAPPVAAKPTVAAPSIAAPTPTPVATVAARPVPAPVVAERTVAPATRATVRKTAARAKAPALVRQSAAAHNRSPSRKPVTKPSTSRTPPATRTPAPAPSDDPFTSAARKFRTPRP
jgi:hypothetical protein